MRLLVLHMLGHGAWRPVWLVDIAAMLETLPPGFNWELCSGSDPVLRNWLGLCAGLARDLLGCDLSGSPQWIQEHSVPGWVSAFVLKAWSHPFDTYHTRPSLRYVARHHPWRIPGEVMARWPNPLRAHAAMGASFTLRPSRVVQARCFFRRMSELTIQNTG